MRTTLDDSFTARPLLETRQTTDFERNFRQLEKTARRPYSLAKVIRELAQQPPRLTGFEQEVDQELSSLNHDRQVLGRYVPLEALRRDLSVGGLPTPVQTSVGEDIIPFLRYKSATGRLGATLLTDLIGGPWRLPRATGTGGANWQPETADAIAANVDPTFDAVVLTPARISATAIISKQLVAQSQPAIEQFLIDELSEAIAIEVDRVVLNGSGVSPQPTGILSLPVNPAGTYAYNARSPDVVFGGSATWASALKFEATLAAAQVHNDSGYGWVASPDVRQKWMAMAQVANFPRYLWEQPTDGGDGTIAGRPAVSTSQMPTGKIIFGRWSDAMIATWLGTEILVNPFVRAIQAEHVITLNLFVAVAFKYSSAFVASSDSASQ